MTDEQIIQKAEEYVSNLFLSEQEEENYKFTFIDGAHSRDEEIKELKEEIESLQEQYNTCFDGFTKRGIKLGELMRENVQLRNPWISVEERLPEDDKTVLVWFGGCYTVAVLRDNEWWECTGYQTGGGWSALDKIPDIASSYITHWMSIPALNPAEQLISGLQEMNQQFKKGE